MHNIWYISNHFNIKVNKIIHLLDVFCGFHLLYESNSLSNYGPFRCQVSPSGLRHIPGWRYRGVPSGPSSTSNAAETSQVGTGAGAEAWCLECKAARPPIALEPIFTLERSLVRLGLIVFVVQIAKDGAEWWVSQATEDHRIHALCPQKNRRFMTIHFFQQRLWGLKLPFHCSIMFDPICT